MNKLESLYQGRLPRLVMFDLDGTLIDPVPDFIYAANEMQKKLNGYQVSASQVGAWIGDGARKLVERILSRGGETGPVPEGDLDFALEIFIDAYTAIEQSLATYPGAMEFLGYLDFHEIPLGLVTNRPERLIGKVLGRAGLKDRFRWIVGGDTLPEQKPNPAGLFHIMTLADTGPSESLFIGDSGNDVQAARAADVCCVAVSYGYNRRAAIEDEHPQSVVDNLYSLAKELI